MLNRFSHWLLDYTTGTRMLGWLVLLLVFAVGVIPSAQRYIERAAGHPIEILDLQMGKSPAQVHQLLDSYGIEGRMRYITVQTTADVAYPLVYTFFFGLLLSWLLQRYAFGFKRLNLIVLLPFIFDLLENGCIVLLNWSFPEPRPVLAQICGVFTLLKFGWLAVVILVCLGVWLKGVLRR